MQGSPKARIVHHRVELLAPSQRRNQVADALTHARARRPHTKPHLGNRLTAKQPPHVLRDRVLAIELVRAKVEVLLCREHRWLVAIGERIIIDAHLKVRRDRRGLRFQLSRAPQHQLA